MIATLVLLILDLSSESVDIPLWGYLTIIGIAFLWNIILGLAND